MENQTVQIVAHLVARVGEEGRVQAEFEKLIEPSRAEPGCLKYELFVNKETPGDFLFLQEYVSDAACQAHMDSKHVAAAIEDAVPLLEHSSGHPALSTTPVVRTQRFKETSDARFLEVRIDPSDRM